MSSYATGYHQTVPAGFSTPTSDTTAIKDQESKLETTYNPTQVCRNILGGRGSQILMLHDIIW